jgi:hypothetical protein
MMEAIASGLTTGEIMPSNITQLTLRDQLKDPIFRKWFSRNPQLGHGWRVYYQKTEGARWKYKDFDTWNEGYQYLAKKIAKVYDISLTHKLRHTRPPVVKRAGRREYYYPHTDKPQHFWCLMCRRMTKFGYFKRHHNMPIYLDPTQLRCRICGVRHDYQRKY